MSSDWSPNLALPKPPLERAMKILTGFILILSGLFALEMFVTAQSLEQEETVVKPAVPDKINISIQPQISAYEPIEVNDSEPEINDSKPGINDTEPSYIPTIRPYLINKDHDIWHAEDPSSYITPDNAWVKYYASRLYIDFNGRLRYKNMPVPLRVDIRGNILQWIDKPFVNTYISDDDQFNFPPDGDVWVMPEYYLTHGMKDDCDGWMVTVTSIMKSGELSVKDNSSFVKTVVPAKAVLGYMGNFRDGWTEYKAYGKTFLTTTSLMVAGFGDDKQSVTEFVEKKDKTTAKPVFEFDDKHFGPYKAW